MDFCRLVCGVCLGLMFGVVDRGFAEDSAELAVGVAREDVTPEFPIRLNGFGGRTKESQGVRQAIYAKALAIGAGSGNIEHSIIVITVDTLGIPDDLHERVAAGIEKQTGVPRHAIAICASHTHSAPMIVNCANTLFGNPIPDDQWQRIQKYTANLEARLVTVAVSAFKSRQPAKLSWGQGQVSFAQNRRTSGGPVDHDLPLMAVHSLDGKLRAVFTNYACHCVTLSDDMISGDWAGYAMEHIQRLNPGCEALISIGCGADSNPRGGVLGAKADAAEALGVELAQEVQRLLKSELSPITSLPDATSERVILPLAPLPSRDEWAVLAKSQNAIGYHARVQLERLDRGEPLLSGISYPVQSFSFGDELSWLFLPGEVVVDYSLRLKQELNGDRLWVHAYANACPGYVPSERILKEGGYEGGGAMVYYDIPGPYATGLEQKIVDAAKRQLEARIPATAQVDPSRTNGIRPLSPKRAVASLRMAPGMHAELVTSEPQIESPVSIAFGPRGELWVAEMWDYPQGGPSKSAQPSNSVQPAEGSFNDTDGQSPGVSGRVRCLRDRDGNGTFETSSVFLEGIPFPTGVTVWRDGLLVCAAPDILFAKDADGDGKAESVEKLFTGFATHNFQARVNSLEYGLDGWVYGSCGLFGGRITSTRTGQVMELGQRDFRCNPDTGAFEPAGGSTQQGRVRNDWGDWFGCNNSVMLMHYPLEDAYLRRNPLLAPERTVVPILAEPDPGRLYSISSQVLFALSGPPNRPTAACGLGIYRDDLLGASLNGNTLTCEPVNNLVHRQVLHPSGATFESRRADDEQDREFLASTDPWFRPVQVRTGTDGALWVVDMYRYVIEHPVWIPAETLAKLDTRAGADMGRLYRIVPDNKPLRAMTDLTALQGRALAEAMQTANGTQRDLVQQQILWTEDRDTIPALIRIGREDERPEVRVQAIATLQCLNACTEEFVAACLSDEHPQVRRHAISAAESMAGRSPALQEALVKLASDANSAVRLQLLYSAGQLPVDAAARVFETALKNPLADSFERDAFESSLTSEHVARLAKTLEGAQRDQLLPWIAAIGSSDALADELERIAQWIRQDRSHMNLGRFESITRGLLKRKDIEQVVALPDVNAALELSSEQLETLAGQEDADADLRSTAVRILGILPVANDGVTSLLYDLLSAKTPPAVQQAAVAAIARRSAGDGTATDLLANWPSRPPGLRRAIIGQLLERPEWTRILLSHIHAGTLASAELELSQQQQLLNHSSESIRRLAVACLKANASGNRQEIVNQYVDGLSDSGDPLMGREVFRKQCSNCHRLQEIGHAVGPDLANYAGKPASAMVVAMMDPGQAVDPRYQSYIAVLNDGRSLTGLVAEETATSLTLLAPEGKRETILRSELEELRSTGKSLMPEGFEKNISQSDMNHLWAWIRTQRQPSKDVPGNVPVMVQVPSEGNGVLKASEGEIYGGDITFEMPFQNIGYWHGKDDQVRWRLHSKKPREVLIWAEWACDTGSAGNAFQLDGLGQTLKGNVVSTGGWDRYQMQRLGKWIIPEGDSEITLRPAGELQGALADLRALHLVVAGGVPLATGNVVQASKMKEPQSDEEIALALVDDQRSASDREAMISLHLSKAAVLLPLMAKGLSAESGSAEEYRRIPWIWRVAIAAAKSGDDALIRSILENTLPEDGQRLEHWQAVVIGGGIINGMSLQGRWPKADLTTMIGEDRILSRRWSHAIEVSVAMLDDTSVPEGTRYDALRMVAMLDWTRSQALLKTYLYHSSAELQMGAVSGLSDVPEAEAASLQLDAYSQLTDGNQKLARSSMLRSEARSLLWLDAMASMRVPVTKDPEERKALLEHSSVEVRMSAQKVLGKE